MAACEILSDVIVDEFTQTAKRDETQVVFLFFFAYVYSIPWYTKSLFFTFVILPILSSCKCPLTNVVNAIRLPKDVLNLASYNKYDFLTQYIVRI